MTTIGLTIRAHRFEAASLALLAAIGLGGTAFVVARLLAFGIPTSCFVDGPEAGTCIGLGRQIEAYLDFAGFAGGLGLGAILVLAILPSMVAGMALGAKEIDRGTTAFAWSLATSRRRWFLGRVLPAGVALVAIGLIGGVMADMLQALRDPGLDPARTFQHLGLRGIAVPALALAVFGVTLAAGTVLGRILPTLLVGAMLVFGVWVGVSVASDTLLGSETVVWMPDNGSQGLPGQVDWRNVDYEVMTPEGEILTQPQAYARYGNALYFGDEVPPGTDLPPGAVVVRQVIHANPGDLYPFVAARMAVLYAALGLASIVLAFAIVDRRRP
jgi:ABC-type transport system involved in multi-copper enzyme maturation permease subunit